jgi:DNA invertase Pin-like site-specific DNA recombinase
LEGRARELGFQKVIVIDDDLGISGTGNRERPGFARLLAAVCNGEVGAVLALEASRLARNNRDWHHLIDLCVLTDTLVVDAEGIYDPRLLNDRMLLGLKGTMSEFEIGILRQRAQEAYRQKVQRGEVMTLVPIGFERSGPTGIQISPDRQVQEAIRTLFDRFESIGTLRQVLLWYHQEQILFPSQVRRNGMREIHWRVPSYQHLHRILQNPTYAGAFAHGKSRAITAIVAGRPRKRPGRRLSMEEWPVLIKDHHPGYIEWDRYVKNLETLKGNCAKAHVSHAGAPRSGSALLAGLLRCGKCGLKLSVAYRGGPGRNGRYVCMRGTREEGKPICACFAAFRVDQAVEAEVLEACQPLAVEASILALTDDKSKMAQKRSHLEIALEKARYEADLARRQYDAVDPANRLVAAELELRWNAALAKVGEVESRLAAAVPPDELLTEGDREKLLRLGSDLKSLWDDPSAPWELKKRIVRTIIQEIMVRVDDASHRIELMIHWAGGAHTQLYVTKNKYGRNRNAASQETVELIRKLAEGWPDRYIAQMLNRMGCLTGTGKGWSETRVKTFRNQHSIAVFPVGKTRPWLTMQESAEELGVNVSVLRTLAKHGKLLVRQVATGLPYMIERSELERPEVKNRVRDAKLGLRGPLEDARQTVISCL